MISVSSDDDAFVVTWGEFSEHSVECVFTTQAAAQAYVDELNAERVRKREEPQYDFVRVPVNPPLPSTVRKIK